MVVLGVVVGATVGSSASVVVGARSVVAPAVDAVLRSSVEALHAARTDATKRTSARLTAIRPNVPAVARRRPAPPPLASAIVADRSNWDAVVVGAGPNGLVAAITLARAGRRVLVFEGADTPGGGCRTAELTGPGFRHDVCSSVHPLGIGSPAMRDLPLERHGVRWVQPDIAMAHPIGRGAALLHRSLEGTVAGLGRDGAAWRRMVAPVPRRASRPDRRSAVAAVRPPPPDLVGQVRGVRGLGSDGRRPGRRCARTRARRCSPGWPPTACCRSAVRSRTGSP